MSSRAPTAESLRLATLLEVLSVVMSVVVVLWVVVPLAPGSRTLMCVPAVLALSLIVYSHYVRRETLEDLGLTGTHLRSALGLVVLPTLLAAGVLFAIGTRSTSIRIDSGLLLKVVTLPLWGLFQQYILQAFIYRRVRTLFESPAWSVLTTAALFAAVHLPNPLLTALTFVGALVWTMVYERAPNLYVLGVSHGLISLVAMTTLPAWVLPSLSVGYKYLYYQNP
ncbi:MAG: CPBP family intramembrane glutamic endopeptidase [Acidobacteriota bacterium]